MSAALAAFASLVLLVQISVGSAAAVLPAPGDAESSYPAYVPGEVVVGFTKGSDSEQISDSLEAIEAEDSESVQGLAKTRVVEIDEADDVEAAADELDDQAGVRWAEPNYIVQTQSLPNDPKLGLLWGLRNVGQNSQLNPVGSQLNPDGVPIFGRPGVDVGAPSAWKKTTGSTRKIAVIDSGIEATHPDLGPNLNRKLSRNFVATPDSGDPFDWKVDPDAWDDQNSHGTHVAGTIGAVGDNGLGVTGVNWKTRLVAVRSMGSTGSGNAADIAESFAYVGRKGIPIANASIGGQAGGEEVEVWKEAIEASPDTLFVISAMNAGTNNDEVPYYPCNFKLPNILCVAAIDSRAKKPDFSNYGRKSVDVGAPGVAIESTVPNFSFPLDVDFTKGIANFDQQPYPWKLEDLGAPVLIFDGHDGDVPSPVAEASATLKDPVDLSDQRFCRIDLGKFQFENTFKLGGNQSFSIEYRIDGGPAKQVPNAEITAGDLENIPEGTPLTFPLAELEGASEVEFSLVFKANGTLTPLPLIVISKMKVECVSPMPPEGAYKAISGTSMASPHVAGVAGLVKSVAPKAGPEKLKKIIMNSVVPTKSLKGKTVTGGRVDAGRAVRFIRPADKARLTGLKISPKKLRLRPGRSGQVKVRVRNGGGATAKRLRVCLKAPRRYVKPAGCTKSRKLGSGKSTTFGIRVRLKGTARSGQSIRLKAVARARGTGNRNVSSRLKVTGPGRP
ncbi:MAG: S8 family serine peptidase [Thermoleophilia bacterium]|nr:S8 family serine peptidase [Thermoleophilia bacterium]